jgi:hypothetical protein
MRILSSKERSREETGMTPRKSSPWDKTGSLMKSKHQVLEAEVELVFPLV